MINLSNLKPAKGAIKSNTRLGRGQGSGGGGTAKRGHNGAKSRSGYSQKRGFEGGQMPLQRRVPKFGFKNINRVEYKAINLDTLQYVVEATGVSSVDLGVLYNLGLTQKNDKVKILGRGELKSAIEVKVNAFSKSAAEAIEKAGGSVSVDATFNPEDSVALKGKKLVVSVKETAVEEKVIKVVESKATTKVEVAVSKKVAVKKISKVEGDNLKKIEGVGPKIAELLSEGGFDTFAKLAEAKEEDLQGILSEAGSRYAAHNPSTWAEQAVLAAAEKWEELKELQDRLNGGKPE
ncbi:MAG: large subunit ribosomal protein L15 [Arcticibacterium sp.]|jgi:large subunit ribosomal protein L15